MHFRHLTIGQRITLGYAIIITILMALTISNFTGVADIVHNAKEVISGNKLQGLLVQKEVDHLNWAAQVNRLLTDATVNNLSAETDDHRCALGKWLYSDKRRQAEALVPSLAPLLLKIETPHQRLHSSAKQIKAVFRPADTALPQKLSDLVAGHLAWAGQVRDSLLNNGNSTMANIQLDPEKCALGTFLNSAAGHHYAAQGNASFQENWQKISHSHDRLHQSAAHIQAALSRGDRVAATTIFQQETLPMLKSTIQILRNLRAAAIADLKGITQAKQIYVNQTLPALAEVQDLLHQTITEAQNNLMSDETMLAAANSTRLLVAILAAVAIAAALIISYFTASRLNRLLTTVVDHLSQGATEVNSAALQVSQSSNSLAEGAAEQAASLEETSTSMEEISATTQQNKDNIHHAHLVMDETKEIISKAEDSMDELKKSMVEISTASGETQDIVKTIDDIAFQTNLLALNAAVEAARAGVAGAGFAVVADEVRNLAQRAAKSAQETSALIDSTVAKVETGVTLLNNTNNNFTQAAQATNKMNDVINEISTASEEQATGIDQVNRAVSEIDGITQHNAAAAEQSAAAASQLTGQASSMEDMVMNLAVMVNNSPSPQASRPNTTPTNNTIPLLQVNNPWHQIAPNN